MTNDASRKAFESWKKQSDYPRLGTEMGGDDFSDSWTAAQWVAWQACDAKWREKLLSNDMAELVAMAIRNVNKQRCTKVYSKELALAVIAAILEEV